MPLFILSCSAPEASCCEGLDLDLCFNQIEYYSTENYTGAKETTITHGNNLIELEVFLDGYEIGVCIPIGGI